jgi:hypothetical protein
MSSRILSGELTDFGWGRGHGYWGPRLLLVSSREPRVSLPLRRWCGAEVVGFQRIALQIVEDVFGGDEDNILNPLRAIRSVTT